MTSQFDSIQAQRQLLALSDTPGVLIPDYVAQYTPLTKKAASKIPSQLFADPDRHTYPMDSKEATWLSAGLFLMQKRGGELTQYKPVQQDHMWTKFESAASVYGIADDLNLLKNAVDAADNVKTAAAEDLDENYGWLIKDASGATVSRRYPMFDASGVKRAANYFMEHRGDYPQAIRTEICSSILRKAASYDIDIDTLNQAIVREAGMAVPQPLAIMHALLDRGQMCKDAEASALLINLNEIIAIATPAELNAATEKLAGIMEDFDIIAGLNTKYDKMVQFPADVVHGMSIKQAEDLVADAITIAGVMCSKKALAALDPDRAYADVLGTAFTDGVKSDGELDATKLACALSALDTPEQHALMDHLRYTYAG